MSNVEKNPIPARGCALELLDESGRTVATGTLFAVASATADDLRAIHRTVAAMQTEALQAGLRFRPIFARRESLTV